MKRILITDFSKLKPNQEYLLLNLDTGKGFKAIYEENTITDDAMDAFWHVFARFRGKNKTIEYIDYSECENDREKLKEKCKKEHYQVY